MPDTNNIITRIHFRSDLGENFDNVNDKIPEAGEPIVYMPSEEFGNHMQLKIGDGTTTLGNLKFVGDDIRERIDDALSQINDTIEQIEDDIEETKSDIEESYNNLLGDVTDIYNNIDNKFSTKVRELEESASNTLSSIQALQEDLEPLATWTGPDDSVGVAGFVAKADENSAILGSLVTWQGETNESIAGFRQEVQDKYATQESVTAVKTATEDSIASVRTEVTNTYATKEDVLTFKNETTTALTAVTETVDANSANITSLTSWKSDATESITAIEQNVSDVESSINSLTSWQSDTNTAITNIQQKANDQESKITLLTDWKDSSVESITQIKQQSDANKASIEQIAVWQDTTTKSIADFKTEVSKNYATQQMVSKVDDNLASFKQTVTDTYATTATVQSVGNALTLLESTVKNDYATNTSVATVEGKIGTAIAASEQKATETYAMASQVASIVDKDGNIKEASIVAAVNNNISEINITAENINLEGQKLNIKVDATNIEGTLTIGQLPDTVAETDDIPTSEQITTITNNTISTTNVTAQNLKVNAANIEGTLTIGKLPTTVAQKDDVPTESEIVTIAKGAITADYVKTLGLEVGNQITMGENATISWGSVTDKDDVASISDVSTAKNDAISAASADATSKANAAKSDAINTASTDATNKANAAKTAAIDAIKTEGYTKESRVTEITRTTIETEEITATKLHVDAANINGTLTANQIAAEAITSAKLAVDAITSRNYYYWNADGQWEESGSGMRIDLADGTIHSKNLNLDAEGKLSVTGTIHATEGDIGGWNLTSTALKKYGTTTTTIGSNTYYQNSFGLQVPHTTGQWVISVGNLSDADWGQGDFRVKKDGTMYSKKGYIAQYEITDTFICSRPNTSTSPGKDDTVFLLSQDWSSVYAAGVKKDDWRLTIGSNFGVTSSGELYALSGKIGGFTLSENSITTDTGYGIYIKKTSDKLGVSLLDDGLTFLTYSNNTWSVGGYIMALTSKKISIAGSNGWVWSIPESFITSSDEKVKTNIMSFDSRHDVFFNNLQPRTYQLKEGTSNRQHFGFIAQEVYNSIEKALLTTNDVAAYVEFAHSENKSEEEREFGLRYEEFISLNTWQIQKLKSRVAELEAQIKELTKN